MSLSMLADPVFQEQLRRLDHELASEVKGRGCPHCGARLHSARYPRKPRTLSEASKLDCVRESFCCAGCRRRTTPPSVRFLGRRVYAATIVTLGTAMSHGLTSRRMRRLATELGVHRRTLTRWRQWWTQTIPRSRFWRVARARFMPPVSETALPASLVERYAVGGQLRTATMMRVLSPLSEGRPTTRRGCP